METPPQEWHDKPWLLALLTLAFPLIALVGIWLTKRLPKVYKLVLALAAGMNFLGQLALILKYLLSPN